MKTIYSPDSMLTLFKDIADSLIIHNKKDMIVFLCGGSTVNFYKYFVDKFDVFKNYANKVNVKSFENVTFALTDDRWFEDKNDENINFNQIVKSGFVDCFETLGAKFIKMSVSDNMKNDSDSYNKQLKDLMNKSYKVLIGGVGPDGHTCAILPQENEETFNEMYGSSDLSVSVKVNNIHPNRITLTPHSINLMDEIHLYIIGESKKPILDKLLYENLELWQMPSQIYKSHGNVKIHTDII